MKKRRYQTRTRLRSSWMKVVTSVALAVAVATGGVILSYYQTRRTASPVSLAAQEVDTKKEVLPPNLDGLLPVSAVQELARNAGGSPITNVALENRSGVLVYVTTLSDGTKLGFNAASGNAIALQDDNKPASQEKKTSLPADLPINTSFEAARKLAQEAFPNSKISQIQLNAEDGIVALNVGFTDKAEVDINPANGNVIRVTTPTGATAEAPTDNSSAAPSQSAAESPENGQKPSTDDEDSNTSISPERPGNSDKPAVRIEGILTLANGIYTITDDEATYTVMTGQDLSDLVGKTVRVDGKLQTGDMIQATKVSRVVNGR